MDLIQIAILFSAFLKQPESLIDKKFERDKEKKGEAKE